MIIISRHSDSFGLISTTSRRCLLCARRVVVEGFTEDMLKVENVITAERDKE